MAKKTRTAAQKRATAALVALMKKKRAKGNPAPRKRKAATKRKRNAAPKRKAAPRKAAPRKKNAGRKKSSAGKRRESNKVSAMLKRLQAAERRNPGKLRKVPKSGTGWMSAKAVKIVKRRGKPTQVLVQK